MSDKKKKPQKLKARLARGFPDRSPADIRATEQMMGKIRTVYERFGFEPVETPFVEYTDALGKFLPDQDRPNEGVFSFQDDDEQWLSLRYDLTAPLARHVAENFNDIQLPYRTYRAGWVFRNEKPGPGRFRQFMQFDADIVGAPGVQADAEMCMMMADTMEALGIPRGQYVIRVNNRKVLDGVMEAIGLGGDENAGRRLTVLRAIDKLDRLGIEGVRQLLGEGRKDESGDFTKGAGLTEAEARTVLLGIGIIADTTETYPSSSLYSEGMGELFRIEEFVSSCGYGPDRIRIDPSVVRGLEYYTGPVFEAELLFDVVNEKGEKVQFGSVGGGGRYDGLVSRFMGNPVPATGFSIGVSRLATALKNLGKLSGEAPTGPVLVTIMDRDRIGDYARLAKMLRDGLNREGASEIVPVELFQGNPKDFGKQLKYADRRNCPVAIIQGSDEKERRVVTVKDLIEGKRIAEGITDNAEWRAARPAQEEVSESELVDKVRAILAAQAEDRKAGA